MGPYPFQASLDENISLVVAFYFFIQMVYVMLSFDTMAVNIKLSVNDSVCKHLYKVECRII